MQLGLHSATSKYPMATRGAGHGVEKVQFLGNGGATRYDFGPTAACLLSQELSKCAGTQSSSSMIGRARWHRMAHSRILIS